MTTSQQRKTTRRHSLTLLLGLALLLTNAWLVQAEDSAPAKLRGHVDPVYVVDYFPGKPWILTGSFDRTLKLWDVASLKTLATLEGHTDLVLTFAISSDGTTVASGSQDKLIKIWKIPTELPKEAAEPLKPTAELKGHGSQVYGVAFSPDGKQLASCSADKTVRLWDLATSKEIRKLPEQGGPVYSLAFSSDGQTLLTGGADKTVRLYNAADGKEIRKFEGATDGIYSVTFSPDGKSIAAGGLQSEVLTWNVEDGSAATTLTDADADADIYRVQFNASGSKLMAVTYAAEVVIWNPTSPKPVHRTKLPVRTAYGAAYSPDGGKIVVATEDANAYIIELPESAK